MMPVLPEGIKERELCCKAAEKAMLLLNYRDRSVQELLQRLLEKFPPEAASYAMEYVTHYGYLNDRRYAENYAYSAAGKKGRRAIRFELKQKGIDSVWIEEALEQLEAEEKDTIRKLLHRKAGEPHPLDEKEYRRLYGYFARKGFPPGEICKALQEFRREG